MEMVWIETSQNLRCVLCCQVGVELFRFVPYGPVFDSPLVGVYCLSSDLSYFDVR